MATNNVNTTSQNKDTIRFMELKNKKAKYHKFFGQKNKKQEIKHINFFNFLQEKMKKYENSKKA